MSYYVLRNKHVIPGFLYKAVASWVIALTFITVIGIAFWIADATWHFNLLQTIPVPLRSLLDLCGAYAGIGAIGLYITMWIYWIAVERSSILARIGWLLLLLLTLHYGALIYAMVVANKHVTQATTPLAIGNSGVQPQ